MPAVNITRTHSSLSKPAATQPPTHKPSGIVACTIESTTISRRRQLEHRLGMYLAGYLMMILPAAIYLPVSCASLAQRQQQQRLSPSSQPPAASNDPPSNEPPPLVVPLVIVGVAVLLVVVGAAVLLRRPSAADVAAKVAAAALFLRKPFTCSCMDNDDPFEVAGGMITSCSPNRNVVSPTSARQRVIFSQLGCARNPADRRTKPINRRPHDAGSGSGSGEVQALREFEHGVLSMATGRFDVRRALIGEGAVGAAFRGAVLGHDGLQAPVAIKRFHAAISKEDVEFIRNDLAGQPLRHRNLVYIIGYCLKNQTLYLVYDLMDNGNLEKHLFATERHPLSWSRRFNIIRGVALGLQHLHRNGSIHGSVKGSNVFLEEGDLTPRLGDFGCSWLEPSTSDHIRAVSGLPEVLGCPIPNCTSKATFKADVFYFGALIIEVVCGRRFFGHGVPDGFRFLVDWVWSLHGEGRIIDAVDATLLLEADGDLNRTQAERLLLVGLVCNNGDRDQRPNMDAIVEILQSDNVPPPVVPPKKPIYVPPYQHIHTMMTV